MPNCQDCFRNCDVVTSDRCVEYTGADIACLGICKGDTLYEFEVAIAEQVCALLIGHNIDLSEVTLPCTFLTSIQGTADKNLINILNTLATATCSLKTLIDEINAQLDITFSYNTACLTGLPTAPTRDDILQATILKVCADSARIAAIEADYVTNANLCTLVQACIGSGGGGGGGGGTSTQFKDRMVPNCPIPYIGPLSNFDNTGKGLSANGFDKIYLMNGLNNTPDWRGRSPIGAINNVPGGVLDSVVDPSIPQNAGNNYNLSQKVGQASVTLTNPQVPAHTHQVIDPGHRHHITGYIGGGTYQFSSGSGNFWFKDPDTAIATTGISLGSSGGNQPHTNLQPSIGTYFIIYLP